MIETLVKRGVYQCDIAADLGVSPKTVSRALARGSAPSGHTRRGSLLDPYRAQIDALLNDGVWNAQVILREIQAAGYPGEITTLRSYMRPKRPQRPSRATVRFETLPGRQLQSDWGTIVRPIAGVETTIHFAVNLLAYSRRFHVWCTDSLDAEHTYESLIRAFEWVGGVPLEVLVDNQKAAVLTHRPSGVVFTPRFLDLAGHYGFTPRACKPYRARTKGKDERMVSYLKHHFFVRYRAFESWAHLHNSPSSGSGRKRTSGSSPPSRRSWRLVLPGKRPACSRCGQNASTRRIGKADRSPGMASSMSAAIATPCRTRIAGRRSASASTSTGSSRSTPMGSVSPPIGSEPPRRAGASIPPIMPASGPRPCASSSGPSPRTRRWGHGTDHLA